MGKKGIFLLCVLAGVLLAGQAYAVEVNASGMASGNPDTAREQALTRALREAVRMGAGVDVLSETKVQNFELEFDRVMTSSFGYIESYEVTGQAYDNRKQEYTVNVKAQVAKGRPKMDDMLALRMIVKRMKSPRVMIEATEKMSGAGLDGEMSVAGPVLEEIAQKAGFEIFRQSAIKARDTRDSDRAALLGDTLESKVKKAGITSTSDFKIFADVKGQVGRLREPFPDVKVRDVALGVNLQAVWTDTGEIVAAVALPTTFHKGEAEMSLPYDMPEQLVRHYLTVMLTGEQPAFKKHNAEELFRRIIAKWIVEMDLGAKIQLEFKQIDKPMLDKLISILEKTPDISYVWRREFDRRLFSIVEIETRLSAEQVEDVVLKATNRKYEIDVATKRRLRFVPAK